MATLSEPALAQLLAQTLEPQTRDFAEQELTRLESQPQFAVLLLRIVESSGTPLAVRFAASLLFKNYVRRQWPEAPEVSRLKAEDRAVVKQNIVSLMTRVPEKFQLQLSDAVSVIALSDFPENWQGLIDDLVGQFSATDYNVNIGVLQTAHSIFKRYRHEFRTDELFSELKFVLDRFCPAYLQLFINTDRLIGENSGNGQALQVLFGCLHLLCKVFYSLNSQDLPAFFEDNMKSFMPLFLKYLAYINPQLKSDDDEAGILEKVKSSICEVAAMYATKYEEEFTELPEFVQAIWENLTHLGLEAKYDQLVSTSIAFLSSVSKNPRHQATFGTPEALKNICEKIILPNIQLRESDEELFEDDPIEYIRRDLEGSDADTRRRAAVDLVRSLGVNFESQLTGLFGTYVGHFMQQYAANPTQNWKSKDTGIYLLIAITAQAATSQFGATKTNQSINISEMFMSHIKQDLEAPIDSASVHPVLKVDALKFLNTFRNQLDKSQMLAVFPLVVQHLASSNYVVYTYAAVCLERILSMRINNQSMFNTADIKPFLETLLVNLFGLIERGQTPEKVAENDYLMKTVMRVISIAQVEMMPYVTIALGKLTSILEVISKNPSNPKFNHFVFESIASLVAHLCSVDSKLVSNFESLLHPPIQAILQMDISEFTPYVLQLLAQLLELHSDSGVPQEYQALLPPLLQPVLWESSGNVPALVALLEAYLHKGGAAIAASDKLPAFLGVFQKLIASRLNDQHGFHLLLSIFTNMPMNLLKPFVPQIFNILLMRMQSSKTVKFTNGFLKFVCKLTCAAKDFDAATLIVETLDHIQPKLFQILMQNILLPETKTLGTGIERKLCAIAFTRFVASCQPLMAADYVQLRAAMLTEVVAIAKTPIAKESSTVLPEEQAIYNADIDEAGYQAAFVQLSSTAKAVQDPVADITDVSAYVASQLQIARAHVAPVIAALAPSVKADLAKMGIA